MPAIEPCRFSNVHLTVTTLQNYSVLKYTMVSDLRINVNKIPKKVCFCRQVYFLRLNMAILIRINCSKIPLSDAAHAFLSRSKKSGQKYFSVWKINV